MRRSLALLPILVLIFGLAQGCSLDLGEAPFKCNKGKPKCPDGYQCSKWGNCIKNGFCPSNLAECASLDAGVKADGTTGDATGANCGNGKCDPGETATSCPKDCNSSAVCGNGKCDPGETAASCPKDCGSSPVCGNGKCEAGETSTSCPKDCGSTGCTSGQTLCIGTTTLKYCQSGVWKTDTCLNLCVAGGFGYADTCKKDPTKGTDVCYCGGGFGDPCNDTNKKCGSNLICVNFPTNTTTGFCTKECYTPYSICTGSPTGSYAECTLQVSTPTGTKNICGFVCSLSQPCPSTLKCDYSAKICKP